MFCEPSEKAREDKVMEMVRLHKYELVHPFNDYRVITGAASCALEIFD